MKKLFLILVSVLVLGGCSVDDDISASGGGVSSGGDDMAITTYPNVVEASRTAVEGGYLVDYVYIPKNGVSLEYGIKEFFSNIVAKLGFKVSDFVNVPDEFRRVFNIDLRILSGVSAYSYSVYELQKIENSVGLDVTVGTSYRVTFHKVGLGVVSKEPVIFYRNGDTDITVANFDGRMVDISKFTIFEYRK